MILVFRDDSGDRWRVFSEPVKTVCCYSLKQLKEVQSEADSMNLIMAGFFTYESAVLFDKAMKCNPVASSISLPPIVMGLFTIEIFFNSIDDVEKTFFKDRDAGFAFGPWRNEWNFEQYESAFDQVRSFLASGDSYQINLTFRRYSWFSGNSWQFFKSLYEVQPVPHAAYLRWNNISICSFSPELFFRKKGHSLTMKPMKGTAPVGKNSSETETNRLWLKNSEKNKAENRMITDMIRNDLGKISRNVRVQKLFDLKVYNKVIQMTSTVQAECSSGLSEIMHAVFPCASITGAPKISAMNIIKEVEDSPRSVYCGSMGWWSPDGDGEFNVAIRTQIINHKDHSLEYGTGGAVIWDSTAEDEYRECFHKAAFMDSHIESFRLLESLLLDEGIYLLPDEHLLRMKSASDFFHMNINWLQIKKTLADAAAEYSEGQWKVRLTSGSSGQVEIDVQMLILSLEPVKLVPDFFEIRSGNPFLHYKTNQRYIHQQALRGLKKGEITEATSSNIMLVKDGFKLTSPAESGLLQGTFRSYLLKKGEIREMNIYESDLKSADEIWLINSVREWRKAIF